MESVKNSKNSGGALVGGLVGGKTHRVKHQKTLIEEKQNLEILHKQEKPVKKEKPAKKAPSKYNMFIKSHYHTSTHLPNKERMAYLAKVWKEVDR